jgi:hypothetical protein
MIDGSYFLDQTYILLFRREFSGFLSSKKIIKTKKIIRDVPITEVQYNADGGSIIREFLQRDIPFNISSPVHSYYGRRGNIVIVGDESFSDNPCSSGDVTYLASIVLGLARVSTDILNSGYYRISYQGSLRSVLSSICNDFGCRWFWNPFSNRIEIKSAANASSGVPDGGAGCNVVSSTYRSTIEGTFSNSVITYRTINGRGVYDSKKTTESVIKLKPNQMLLNKDFNENTTRRILFDACPAYESQYNFDNGFWAFFGKDIHGKVSFGSEDEGKIKAFYDAVRAQYNIKESSTIEEALGKLFKTKFSFSYLYYANDIDSSIKLTSYKKWRQASPFDIYYAYSNNDNKSSDNYSKSITNNTLTSNPQPKKMVVDGKAYEGFFESIESEVWSDGDDTSFGSAQSSFIVNIDIGLIALGVGLEVMQKFRFPNEEELMKRQDGYNEHINSTPLDELYENDYAGYLSAIGGYIVCLSPQSRIILTSESVDSNYKKPKDEDDELFDVDETPENNNSIDNSSSFSADDLSVSCYSVEQEVIEEYKRRFIQEKNENEGVDQDIDVIGRQPHTSATLHKFMVSGGSESSGSSGSKEAAIYCLIKDPPDFNVSVTINSEKLYSDTEPYYEGKFVLAKGEKCLENLVTTFDLTSDNYNDDDDSIITNDYFSAVVFEGPIESASITSTALDQPITDSLRSITVSYDKDSGILATYTYETFPPKPQRVRVRHRQVTSDKS